MNAVAERLVVKRTFKAPVERVYAAWTDAEQMKRWFAPGAMSVPMAESDAREGGRYRVQMSEGGNPCRRMKRNSRSFTKVSTTTTRGKNTHRAGTAAWRNSMPFWIDGTAWKTEGRA
jgi:hypothetical protein